MFTDAWTSYGGSQFLNSTGTGRYLDYLCDEVVPFVDERYPTAADRDHRALTGKSSGGYGAMVVPMLRPDVFGALASHAGDALFEACYLPEFPDVARALRDDFGGSWDTFFERPPDRRRLDRAAGGLRLRRLLLARPGQPGRALLPFDVTGRLLDDVWAQWLPDGPGADGAAHADALRSMRRIYLDAGRRDEYYLDLGAQAFASELDKLGVAHTLDLFDGTHARLTYRYPGAIRELVLAIAP